MDRRSFLKLLVLMPFAPQLAETTAPIWLDNPTFVVTDELMWQIYGVPPFKSFYGKSITEMLELDDLEVTLHG